MIILGVIFGLIDEESLAQEHCHGVNLSSEGQGSSGSHLSVVDHNPSRLVVPGVSGFDWHSLPVKSCIHTTEVSHFPEESSAGEGFAGSQSSVSSPQSFVVSFLLFPEKFDHS